MEGDVFFENIREVNFEIYIYVESIFLANNEICADLSLWIYGEREFWYLVAR